MKLEQTVFIFKNVIIPAYQSICKLLVAQHLSVTQHAGGRNKRTTSPGSAWTTLEILRQQRLHNKTPSPKTLLKFYVKHSLK